MSLILFNNTPELKNLNQVGGKAAALSRLLDKKISIPGFIVVTTETFNSFCKKHLGENWNNQKITDIQDVIAHAPFKSEFLGEFKSAWAHLSKSNEYGFAVRSSATLEDGNRFSFAGQFESRLAIKTMENVLASIRICWASTFSTRLETYKRLHNITQTCHMAVIVQHMLNADSSGVAFTVHPISKSQNEALIESTFGIPNLLVEGIITPDQFVVDVETGKILKRSLGTKKYISNLDVNKEIRMLDTPKKKSLIFSLSDKEVWELSDLLRTVALSEGSPQDIEWALADGKFHILQTRPITTI